MDRKDEGDGGSAPTGCGPRMDDAVARRALAALAGLKVEPADPADVFELQHAEGAGASGRVFRACRRDDPSIVVALKVIPIPPLPTPSESDLSSSSASPPPAAVTAVAREIAFLRDCDHPNVVAFRGAYYKSGALWLAMEHCAGGSTASVRARRPLTERQIAVVLSGALRGLAYLHARRKLHRDVKGANILLTRSGRVKLADFGVSAQLPGFEGSLASTLDPEADGGPQYQRGTFVGTPYWMSPEMIQDGAYDHKADIWSLGVTAIELADREPPLFREHPMRALLQIPRNAPPTVREPDQWSQEFRDFLGFVLKKNPRERPTATECLRHTFLRRVEQEQSVFEEDEAGSEGLTPVDSGGDRRSEDVGPIPPSDAAEAGVEDEIADVVARLDADDGSEARGSTHKNIEDPPRVAAAADASISSLTSCSSTGGVNQDQLLDLSVDEGNDLNVQEPSQAITTASITTSRPTVMTLTPARADSPVRRSKLPRSAFPQTIDGSQRSSSALSDLAMELCVPVSESTGDTDADVGSSSSAWEPPASSTSSLNPLAQIDASTAGVRVSALLASLSSSHVGGLLGSSMTKSATSTTGSVVHQPVHDAPPLPPDALLRRSSFGLSVTSSFREALINSRANTTSGAAVEALPASVQWRELRPRQFGVPLDDQQTASSSRSGGSGDASVPALLHLLRRELLLRDALKTTSWIYRASPDARELERVRTAIDRGGGAGFDPAAVGDASVFTSLLKLWLRELPTPLLSPVRSSDVQRLAQLAAAISDDSEVSERSRTRLPLASVHEQVERALGSVKGRRRAVLEWLLDHWLEVLALGASNRMTAHALAVVMAPSVYSCGYGLDVGVGRGAAATVVVSDVVAMLRVLIHWRRACRDTGVAQVVDRLESAQLEREASTDQTNGERGAREVKPVAATQDAAAASLVWPAGGKCGASKLVGTLEASMDGFESCQSVETMVNQSVRRAVGLPDRDSDEHNAGNACESLEHERFVAFQRSVADALTSTAKTSGEMELARRFRLVALRHESSASLPASPPMLKPSNDTWEQLRRELPATVKRLERWLAAAASVEGFRAMVRSECAVFDKRRRLRELQTRGSAAFSPSDTSQRSFVARIGGNSSKLRVLHDLRRRYASSQHSADVWMADGAQRIVEMRRGCHRRARSGDDNDNTREEDAAALVALGKTEPVVGIVLLAALEQSTMPSA